jgi:hypothetical protein
MTHPTPSRWSALLLALLSASCAGKKEENSTGSAPAPSGSGSAALPDAPPSPFSVVLEAHAPPSFSGLEGGVWISDAARKQRAIATGAGDLVVSPMPEGLPGGTGSILRVTGRLPQPLWLSFETLKDDGKVDKNPLLRLRKDSFAVIADDWKPLLVPWTKNRILAASTSSTKLKIKVVEPALPKPPDDLPSARLDDASCAKTLQIQKLTALPTGEVYVSGSCRHGSPKGELRAVVIRWAPRVDAPAASASVAPGAAPPAPSAASASAAVPPASASAAASPSALAPPADAGAPDRDAGAEAADDEPIKVPGIIDLLPGVAGAGSHRGFQAFAPDDLYLALVEAESKGKPGAPRLLHFDGKAWSAADLPATTQPLRGLSGTSDGTLWLITEHEIWKRPRGGSWEAVPPPTRAFPEPGPVWELSQVWGAGPGEVWITGRHSSSVAKRELVLRLKAPAATIRWE